MTTYTAPQLTRLGTLAELTLGNTGTGPAQGGAYGKGSITADGKSGLIGNRSGG